MNNIINDNDITTIIKLNNRTLENNDTKALLYGQDILVVEYKNNRRQLLNITRNENITNSEWRVRLDNVEENTLEMIFEI